MNITFMIAGLLEDNGIKCEVYPDAINAGRDVNWFIFVSHRPLLYVAVNDGLIVVSKHNGNKIASLDIADPESLDLLINLCQHQS